jgi:hypothetical protein
MKKTTLAFLAIVALGINTAIWIGLKSHPGISAENGPMENFQAVCLSASFLLWLILALLSKNKEQQILLMGLSLFNFTFLVLEVDFRHLNAPTLNKIFNGRIRDIWLGALWLGVGILFLRKRKLAWKEVLIWVKSPSGILMILSGAFWLASGLIDKSLTGHRKDLYSEELMEVNATLLMLLSAILFCRKKNSAPE